MSDVVDAAFANLLGKLPESVAERVREKYEYDRASFLKYVDTHTPSKEPAYWAKRGCTKCYGRGILGTCTLPSGQTVYPACPCTQKSYGRWLKQARQEYRKKEQGHEKTAD